MTSKKPKTSTTRSRSASRDRTSTRKNSSKKKSPSRDSTPSGSKSRSPASESKIRRRRTLSSSEGPEISTRVKRPYKRLPRRSSESGNGPSVDVNTSLRVIEKLESSNKIEHRSPKLKTPAFSGEHNLGLTHRILSSLRSSLCCLFHTIFSEASCCVVLLILFPVLTFWLNFLVFSPTSISVGEIGSTPWGAGISFMGALWPSDLHAYFRPSVLFAVVCYFLGMFLVARILPIGRKLTVIADGCPTDVRANGLVMLLLNISAIGLLYWKSELYFKVLQPELIFNCWPAVMTSCLIISFVIGLLAFWHSYHSMCTIRNTGSFIVDLYNGREVRPRVLGTDIKMLLFYPTIIGLRVLEVSLLLHQLSEYGKLSRALIAVMFLHGVHFLDYFIFEPTMLSSFSMANEGFGLSRALRLVFVMPFTHSLNVFYLSRNVDAGYPLEDFKSMHWLLLFGAILLFFLGLWIHRISNNQKYLFRRDPQHTSFMGMKTIPTPSGKRILAGGWWGRCRHPNYLGGIIMAIASTLPAGFSSPLPWISVLMLIIFMLRRTCLVERACSIKYESAWSKYTASVPYRLVPYVY